MTEDRGFTIVEDLFMGYQFWGTLYGGLSRMPVVRRGGPVATPGQNVVQHRRKGP
jgi:hypothetical protein